MVVWQRTVNLTSCERLKGMIGPELTVEQLIRVATGGVDDQRPALHIVPHDGNTFSFSSPSNDLRALAITPVLPEQITGRRPTGHIGGVLGIFVGYGSNLITAVHMRNRLVLLNGTHRAYTLRTLGATHVPCLIEEASSMEDLDLLGSADFKQDAERLLMSPRPPLFKDYFDERLFKVFEGPRRNLVLRVEVKVQQTSIPSF